jgi:hypothetical protein
MVVDGGQLGDQDSKWVLVRVCSPMPSGRASHENATTLAGAAYGQQTTLVRVGKAASGR